MRAIILAAGFGTKLYPLTETKPKALLRLGERTLLDHLMIKLNSLDPIREIILVTNGHFYVDFLKWRTEAHYRKPIFIVENGAYLPEKRKGVVRDLYIGLKARQSLSDDFLVFSSDNYFDFPLSHFLLPCLGHPKSAFIGFKDLKEAGRAGLYGVVELDHDNKITGFHEKPSHPTSNLVSLGVYYFPNEFRLRVFEYLEIDCLNPDRTGDFLAWLIQKETVYGIEFEGTWFDIEDRESYEEAKRFMNVKAVS